MYWLAILSFGFLGLRVLVALVNLLSRPWLPGTKSRRKDHHPLVSVLIPARNEEHHIGRILQDLLEQDYPDLEVLVYDDLSEDQTAAVVGSLEAADQRVRLIRGVPLPAGWLGKNHACHQLAMAARGDFLLFLDADVRVRSGLIPATLSHIKKHQLSLLSIFPQQIMGSLAERVTVPLMNWILVSMLPLFLTRHSSWSSFSAANGQFMMFDAGIYRQHRFHELVRKEKVEDIVIFRLMKRQGLRVQTLLSNGKVQCRMYGSFREAVQGFSKNVFEFFGGSMAAGFAFALITTLGFVPVWMVWGRFAALGYFVAALIIRALVALASRQPVLQNILLSPLQQMAFWVVILVATYNRVFRRTRWKGRRVEVP